jgi:hypothetical protein
MRRVSREVDLWDPRKIGHEYRDEAKKTWDQVGQEGFLLLDKEKCVKEMLEINGKTFTFDPSDIGCVNLGLAPLIICIVLTYVPRNLKLIPSMTTRCTTIDISNEYSNDSLIRWNGINTQNNLYIL